MSKELRTLWTTINNGDYKQAQVKISKELKKSPENGYYLAVQSFVLLKQEKRDQSLTIARRVAGTGVTNIHVLQLLVQVFQEASLVEDVTSMFEAANRRAPQSAEIVELWFDVMIDMAYIKGLVKVSMAHQRSSGTSRESAFRAVFHMSLAVSRKVVSESEQKLFPLLAQRMLEKVRPYQSAQEVYVHALALKMGPNSGSALKEFLKSDEISQKWHSLDLDVMLIETLREHKMYEDLYQECESAILKDKPDATNWLHWSNLVEAAQQLGVAHEQKALDFISAFPSSTDRNSQLALVKLSSVSDKLSLYDAVTRYFEKFGTKRVVVDDLAEYVQLPEFDQQKWLKWLDQQLPENGKQEKSQGTLNTKVNVAKFQCLIAPRGSGRADSNIRAYNDSKPLLKGKDPKDYHSGDDFMLLAALEVLSTRKSDSLAVHKAVVLLEVASRADPHQFSIRLWLVRLYILLGSFTQARAHFETLSIKTMQLEALSYTILTRLGSTFPDRRVARTSDDLYKQASDFTNYIKYAYRGAYTQIEGFMNLHYKLRHSLAKQLSELEKIKIDRLTTDTANTKIVESVNPDDDFVDSRDFDSMWNCRPSTQIPLDRELSIGPIQGPNYVKGFVLREQIIRKLIPGDGIEELSKQLESVPKDEFSDSEKWSLRIVGLLVKSATNKQDPKPYQELSQKLAAPPTDSSTDPNWTYFHHALTVLETCRVVSGYLIRLKTNKNQVKSHLDSVESLRAEVEDIAKAIKSRALEVKNARPARYRQAVDSLSAWAEERNIAASLLEDVIDGIEVSRDQGLTLLRSL